MAQGKQRNEKPTSPELPDAALEGPAAENAYDDDVKVNLGGGRKVSMNELGRKWNEQMGFTKDTPKK